VSNIPTLSSISFRYEVDKDGKVFLDFEYFVKKILIARLKESIIVVDQPCIMTLIQRTLLDDFTEICFNIKEYDQGEIQFIIYKVIKDFSAKLSVSGSRNIKSAFNSLCKILQGRGVVIYR